MIRRAVNTKEIAMLQQASRSALTYLPEERSIQIGRMITAAVPALGILAACAVMLIAVF
jgi:hypothetical protein